MTRGELIKFISTCAETYVDDAKKSIKRNSHMNFYDNEPVAQSTIDALIVDFVNFCGTKQGLDWGLYTKDLRKTKGKDR